MAFIFIHSWLDFAYLSGRLNFLHWHWSQLIGFSETLQGYGPVGMSLDGEEVWHFLRLCSRYSHLYPYPGLQVFLSAVFVPSQGEFLQEIRWHDTCSPLLKCWSMWPLFSRLGRLQTIVVQYPVKGKNGCRWVIRATVSRKMVSWEHPVPLTYVPGFLRWCSDMCVQPCN